jgi:RNA polymerase sigma factor (sigma-70 family)
MTTQNNRKRLTVFFRSEYERLLRFVRQRVDGVAAQDAEDIIHDVALHLFERPDFIGPVEHLSAYVYRALKNRIVDYFRRKRPMSALDENGDAYDDLRAAGMWSALPDSGIRQVEVSHDLARLMAGLNDEEKKLIIDTEVMGKTFSHLSTQCNVPVNTLLSRKSRAMAKIRRDMDPEPQLKAA